MRGFFLGVFFVVIVVSGFADSPPPKFTITGELDVGGTYDTIAGTTTDKPTELKLSPTLADGNVGFNSRILFLPPTDTNTSVSSVPISLDYAYGTYLLYWSLFDQFMTAKVSLGDFADLTDYTLAYNSNGFSSLIQGNAIGGYIEGLTGAELALTPVDNLRVAVFVPWDNTGSGQTASSTAGRTDVNVSYTLPTVFKLDAGYGNSYNGDISGTLVQPGLGTNLAYLNVSLLSVKNLTLGAEYGNYYDVSDSSLVENYGSATLSYVFPNEKTGDSLTFSDDVFYFIPASGTSVIQEYFSTFYTFSQAFSGADLILDLDLNYANNYPGTDSTSPGTLTATDRNLTINHWVKLSLGTKSHILALGYAYNYDIDASKTAYNKLILNGTIYF